MSIFLTCACGQQFETPAANAGRRARCPDCGRALIVPVPVPKPAPFPEDAFETWVIAAPPYSGQAIASLVLGVLFFFGCFSEVPAIVLGGLALTDIDVCKGRRRGRAMAIGGMVLGLFGCLFTLPFVQGKDWERARRSACANNLKQIGIALSNYHCPTDQTLKWGLTRYQAFVGYNAAFTPYFQPLKFADFTDGTSNTLLVGEADRGVPWTRPEDLSFDGTLLLPGLGTHHAHGRGVNTLRADDSILFLKPSIAPAVLNAVLTRSGVRSSPRMPFDRAPVTGPARV